MASHPFALAPSTPKVAPLATSPKTAIENGHTRCPNISPVGDEAHFAVASPSTPSRLLHHPYATPRKLPDGSDRRTRRENPQLRRPVEAHRAGY